MPKAIGTLADRRRLASGDTLLAILHDQLNAEGNFRVEYQLQAPSDAQIKALNSLLGQYLKGQSHQREARLHLLSVMAGRQINSSTDLTKWEVSCVINSIKQPTPEGEEEAADSWYVSTKGREFLDWCADQRVRAKRDSNTQEHDPGGGAESAETLPFVQDSLPGLWEEPADPPDEWK